MCAWARVSAAPRHSWLGCWGVCVFLGALCLYSCHCWVGCAVWVCVLGLGCWLRPAAPDWGVGVCVCLCARSTCTLPLLAGVCGVGVCARARVSAAPRHSWPGCWGVLCVCVRAPRAPRHSWLGCSVWLCVLGSRFGGVPPLLARVLGCVCVCVRGRLVPRHSRLGRAVCGLGVAWHLFLCRGLFRFCARPRFAAPRGRCCLAAVSVPWLWPGACLSGVPRGPASVRHASSGRLASRALVSFSDAVMPFPDPGACARGFTGQLRGARGGRPGTGLFVPAPGCSSGGLAPRRTRSGPAMGSYLAGLELRALRWFACVDLVTEASGFPYRPSSALGIWPVLFCVDTDTAPLGWEDATPGSPACVRERAPSWPGRAGRSPRRVLVRVTFFCGRCRCSLCLLGPPRAGVALLLVVPKFFFFFAPPLCLAFRVFWPWVPWALASCGLPPLFFHFFLSSPLPPTARCFFFLPFFCFFFVWAVYFSLSFFAFFFSAVLCCLFGARRVCVSWAVGRVGVGVLLRRGPVCACAVSFCAPCLCLLCVCCCLLCCACQVAPCWRKFSSPCCLCCPACVVCPLVMFCGGVCVLWLPLGAVMGLPCCAGSCCAVSPCVGVCCVGLFGVAFCQVVGRRVVSPFPPGAVRGFFFLGLSGMCWLSPPPGWFWCPVLCFFLRCIVWCCSLWCVLCCVACLCRVRFLRRVVWRGVVLVLVVLFLICFAVVRCCVLCWFSFLCALFLLLWCSVVVCLAVRCGPRCFVPLPVVFGCLLLGLAVLCRRPVDPGGSLCRVSVVCCGVLLRVVPPGVFLFVRCVVLSCSVWCCCALCRTVRRCLSSWGPVLSGAVFLSCLPALCVFCRCLLVRAVVRRCALCRVRPGVLCCAFPVPYALCGVAVRPCSPLVPCPPVLCPVVLCCPVVLWYPVLLPCLVCFLCLFGFSS